MSLEKLVESATREARRVSSLRNLRRAAREAQRRPRTPCVGCGSCCASGPCLISVVEHGLWTIFSGREPLPSSSSRESAFDGTWLCATAIREWRRRGYDYCPHLFWDGRRYRCHVYWLRTLLKRVGQITDTNDCIMPGGPRTCSLSRSIVRGPT